MVMNDMFRRRDGGSGGEDTYRAFMVRELLVWLVGVPVPIAMVIGLFVF
jgi:hypothetical protein